MGCMRLSIERDRDEARALEVLHAALDAGVRLLDTADAYCLDDGDTGHNERLIRRALQSWRGDATGVLVATKGGMRRPTGRWEPDGRARHLAAACEASRRALGVERIALYQLHVPDPRVALATSVRALASLQRDGMVERIGLSNVTVGQIEEARKIAEVASVQVELSGWQEDNFRNGVAEYCAENQILLLAYRPLGGRSGKKRLETDPVLRELASKHGATPFEIALAWLADLSPVVIPLPGPTRVETALSLARAAGLGLDDEDRARLDQRFPAGRLLRVPRAKRRPAQGAEGDVVLVMGLPAAGKSTLAEDFVRKGYERLNRDEAGGRLADLIPALDRALASGRTRVVLDNTYGTRQSRNAVIETAWEHGVPVRCVWLKTSLEDAQVNAVRRLVSRYGKLLGPEEIKDASAKDPGAFPPVVLFRHRREQEPPEASEGFTRVDEVAFERARDPAYTNRALILWYDGVLRASRSGKRSPVSPEDVTLLPGRTAVVRRHLDEGWLVLGLSWHPEVASRVMTPAQVEACNERTGELLGARIEVLYCPHGEGPPVCWCRKPMPGLGVVLIERHRLDAERCVYVGRETGDKAFARALGFGYRDAADFFGGA
jgi:aryl-alcohol dehydrogenase-like predicted oxidoreductase/histidinol phosphatase-like enzyme